MHILIALVSAIVGFLFGGPILGVAVLLIGLAILFPGTFGWIAGILGAMIVAAVVFNKFDIGVDTILFSVVGVFLLMVALVFISDSDIVNSNRVTHNDRVTHNIVKAERKIAERKNIENAEEALHNFKITCNSIDTLEDGCERYNITPNTNDVWSALCDYFDYHGKNTFLFNKVDRSSKSVSMQKIKKDEKISLKRKDIGIVLTLKNIENPPYFVPRHKKENIGNESLRNNTATLKEKTGLSVADELLKLKALENEGIITKEEFVAHKHKILS